MLIRIRWRGTEPAALSQQVALALGSLFAPLALLAFAITFWAFASEAQWAREFWFQGSSLLSHWQVWLSIAAVLLVFGRLLGQVASRGAASNQAARNTSEIRREAPDDAHSDRLQTQTGSRINPNFHNR